ncbi:hypothetical protein [Comamonas composti]|uniref:hypothetical protein n=1 Tax=Comamonas composti TaxID=408558 RepID=UPI0004147044|nr:hypothetical protein [Comamonas composti]
MSNFIYNSYCVEHPGVVQVYQSQEEQQRAAAPRSRSRANALVAFTALAALMLLAQQIASAWGSASMINAWAILLLMGLASLALFSAPVRRAALVVRAGWRAWVESRQQAAADERIWNAALQDARLMADLARAMERQSR